MRQIHTKTSRVYCMWEYDMALHLFSRVFFCVFMVVEISSCFLSVPGITITQTRYYFTWQSRIIFKVSAWWHTKNNPGTESCIIPSFGLFNVYGWHCNAWNNAAILFFKSTLISNPKLWLGFVLCWFFYLDTYVVGKSHLLDIIYLYTSLMVIKSNETPITISIHQVYSAKGLDLGFNLQITRNTDSTYTVIFHRFHAAIAALAAIFSFIMWLSLSCFAPHITTA